VLASFTARQILIGILCSWAMTEASTGRQPIKLIRFEYNPLTHYIKRQFKYSMAQKAFVFDDKSFIIFVSTQVNASSPLPRASRQSSNDSKHQAITQSYPWKKHQAFKTFLRGSQESKGIDQHIASTATSLCTVLQAVKSINRTVF
jgi:hypothetical protein